MLKAVHRLQTVFAGVGPREGCEVWSGERPATPDGIPFVERVPGTAKIYLNTGHGHTGLTFAAVTAQLVAALAGSEQPALATALSSRRFR